MEVEKLYGSILKKIGTLNFALDVNYNVTKVINEFQLSVYYNERFSGIETVFF